MRILYSMTNMEYTAIGRYCVAYSLKHPEEYKKDQHAQTVYELFANDLKETDVRVSLIPEQYRSLCRIIAVCMKDAGLLYLAEYIVTRRVIPENLLIV